VATEEAPAGLALITTSLPDGTRIVFRPVVPEDKEVIRHGFEQLSPESRYRRFFSPMQELSDKLLRYLTEIDYRNHFAWIAQLPDVEGSPVVGVGRWVRLADDPDGAEAAVTVIDAYHQRGIGSAMLRVMAQSAVDNGINHFVAYTLGDNEPMIRLLEEAGAIAAGSEMGTRRFEVPLPSDPEELALTPAPHILRAVAQGRLPARPGPEGGGVRFISEAAENSEAE
jgi:RimJ/RimL family protein N-acetyltransferase